jgi:hypothetical protein
MRNRIINWIRSDGKNREAEMHVAREKEELWLRGCRRGGKEID